MLKIGALGLSGLCLGDVLRLRAQAAAPAAKRENVGHLRLAAGRAAAHGNVRHEAGRPGRVSRRVPARSPPTSPASTSASCCRCTPRSPTSSRSSARSPTSSPTTAAGTSGSSPAAIPASPVGFVNDHPTVGSIVAKMRERRERGPAELHRRRRRRAATAVDVFSFGSRLPGPGVHAVHRCPATRASRSSRCKTSSLSTGHGRPAGRPRAAARAASTSLRRDDRPHAARWTRWTSSTSEAVELLTSDKARAGVRPVAGDRRRCASATACTPGASGRCWPGGWSKPGCSFVTMVMENPYPPGVPYPATAYVQLGLARGQLPPLRRRPRPLPDLRPGGHGPDRGPVRPRAGRDVLLIVTGEFGRTPRHQLDDRQPDRREQPGRDHWPQAMSLLVAGGGMRTGQVDRLDESTRRTPQGPPADAQRPVGDGLPPPGHRPRNDVPRPAAGRCRSCRSASRSRELL